MYDTARRLPEPSIHIALTTTEHIFLEHLIHGLLQGRQPLQRNRPICMMCKICLKGPAGEGVRLSRSVDFEPKLDTCSMEWNMLPLRDYHSHSRVLALDRPIIDCRRTLIANQHWCTPAPLYEASSSSFRTPWTLRKPRCTSLILRDRAICHGLNAVRHLLVCEMASLRRTLMHALYFLNFANLRHGLSYVSRVMAPRMLLPVVCRIGTCR